VAGPVLSTNFASDPPLCAEDRETDTEGECLPVTAELLATRGTEKVAHLVSDTEEGMGTRQLTSTQATLYGLARTVPAWVLGERSLTLQPPQ
jgi:hypothetical protein